MFGNPPRQTGLNAYFQPKAKASDARGDYTTGTDGVLILHDDEEKAVEKARVIPQLPHGVVYLPGFLNLAEQRALMTAADEVATQCPWEIPEVNRPNVGGAGFGTLYFAQSGSRWLGRAGVYDRSRGMPPIPPTILDFAQRAVEAALSGFPSGATPPFPRPPFDTTRPKEEVFTCLANYYPVNWGKISPHADHSEEDSKASGARHPVVSFSVGDQVCFQLYPNGDKEKPINLLLKSGDALLFGGAARLIPHGIMDTPKGIGRPIGLGMVPGRLNITLRVL